MRRFLWLPKKYFKSCANLTALMLQSLSNFLVDDLEFERIHWIFITKYFSCFIRIYIYYTVYTFHPTLKRHPRARELRIERSNGPIKKLSRRRLIGRLRWEKTREHSWYPDRCFANCLFLLYSTPRSLFVPVPSRRFSCRWNKVFMACRIALLQSRWIVKCVSRSLSTNSVWKQ